MRAVTHVYVEFVEPNPPVQSMALANSGKHSVKKIPGAGLPPKSNGFFRRPRATFPPNFVKIG